MTSVRTAAHDRGCYAVVSDGLYVDESDGFEYDTHRSEAWRYRDYVIRSIRADKPYDQFLREQIAGDLLPAASPAQAAYRPRRLKFARFAMATIPGMKL